MCVLHALIATTRSDSQAAGLSTLFAQLEFETVELDYEGITGPHKT